MPDKCAKQRRSLVRPHTALGTSQSRKSERTSESSQEDDQNIEEQDRPQSAHLRDRGEVDYRKKVSRLQKPHLKAKTRIASERGATTLQAFRDESPPSHSSDQSGSISRGAELEVVTMVGGKPGKPAFARTGRTSPARADKKTTISRKEDDRDKESASPEQQHQTFETWLAGSPHDSDEYDTDLEAEKTAHVKALAEKAATSTATQGDPTGVQMYEDVCKKLGFVPVSYMRRQMGKRNIRMRHHYLGGRAARPLAFAFRYNTITENLDLSDNYLESTGAVSLAAMLRDNTFITSLNLSNNFIGSYGVAALADMLDHNTTLKSLSLAGNRLVDKDAFHFIEPLKNNLSLTFLDLSNNDFEELGGIHLGDAIAGNDGITELDLSWNGIRRNGAVAVAASLKVNTFLEVLDLSWNGFGEEGVEELARALQVNNYLKVLDLTNNRIDTQTAKKLALGLKKNACLETLILNLNPVGDQGVEAILNAADVHPCLTFLSVEELGISPANLVHIKQLEEEQRMIILYGGSGGYKRNTSLMSVLKALTRFTQEHRGDMETAFQAQDKDRSGVLLVDEVKMCLRTAGLRLTGKQLDLLLDEIDYSHVGQIKYRELLSGKIFEDYHRRRPSRGFALTRDITVIDMESQDNVDDDKVDNDDVDDQDLIT